MTDSLGGAAECWSALGSALGQMFAQGCQMAGAVRPRAARGWRSDNCSA